MTKTFTKQQQELAREWFEDEDGAMRMDKWNTNHLDTLITQIITNTGEELMRLAEGEAVVHKGGGLVMIPAHKVFEHITSITGVEK